MKRRLFTKLLALGAGSSGFAQLAAEETDGQKTDREPDELAQADSKSDNSAGGLDSPQDMPEPVTVADFVPIAKDKLPNATFEYIATGSGEEVTLRDNVEAFRRIRVVPPLMHGVSDCDLSTTVLNQPISMPILLAPVAALRMYHPQGAIATARAAAAAGTLFAVSSSAGSSAEEVASAAKGPKWFQLYVPKDKAVAKRLVQRVEKAGFQAIVVTVDLGEWKDADRRNRFSVPKEMLLKHLRDVGYTHLKDDISDDDLNAFNLRAWDLSLSWDFFKWLRSVTKLPLLIKGVLRPEDAKKAVSLGLDGIIVSNHGGRRLDGMPATIDALPEIAKTVDGRIDILMDGGIRRGTDILKALALGAKAVLIGRPYAWALAADGEAGVKRVLDLLKEELQNAMVTSGCATVADVDNSLLTAESLMRL